MKREKKGPLARGLAIQLALAMLSTGKAKSKVEAATMAGIEAGALTPSRLQVFASSNPIGKKLTAAQPSVDLLTVTAEVEGKRVSAREAFSSGVEASVRVIARLGKRVGKLTKAQRAHLLDAKRWLEMSRANGLFAPAAHVPRPAELPDELPDSEPEPESVPGSLAEFMGGDDLPPEGEPVA